MSKALLPSFAAALLLLSCDTYDGFEMTAETSPPAAVTVDASSVIVPQGIAVAVSIRAPGAEDPETGEVYINLSSSDPSVINAWPTVERNVFVVYGVAPGTALLTVDVEGQDNETVPAKVTTPEGVSGDAAP